MTSSTSTCTSPSPNRMAAAGRARGRLRSRSGSSPSCPAPWFAPRDRGEDRRRLRPRLRPAQIDRPPARFQGNFGVFVRAYAYILRLGGDGLSRRPTCGAERQLPEGEARRSRAGKYLPVAFDRHCMHDSCSPAADEAGARYQDAGPGQAPARLRLPPADRLLSASGGRGLMIEPTETETRETLDAFAEAIEKILEEAEADPDIARSAPYRPRFGDLTRSRRRAGRWCGRPFRRSRRTVGRVVGRASRLSVRQTPAHGPWGSACDRLQLRQLLLQVQYGGEEIAVLVDPRQHVARLEDE